MSEIELSRIRQIGLAVSDVGRAVEFYRDVLGLRFLFAPGPDLAFLAAGDIRIMLATGTDQSAIGANSVLYFTVADAEEAYAGIVSRGAKGERAAQLTARMPDHELWIAFIRDPDGNLIGLMEERAASPPRTVPGDQPPINP